MERSPLGVRGVEEISTGGQKFRPFRSRTHRLEVTAILVKINEKTMKAGLQ